MGPLGDGGRFLDATDRELEDSEESGVSQDLWEYEEVVQRVTVKRERGLFLNKLQSQFLLGEKKEVIFVPGNVESGPTELKKKINHMFHSL